MFAPALRLGGDFGCIQLWRGRFTSRITAHSSQQRILSFYDLSNPLGQLGADQVNCADGEIASDFITVARPYTAQSGADILPLNRLLVQDLIFGQVPGHHQVGSLADHEILARVDATRFEPLELSYQSRRFNNYARRNEIHDRRMQDTTRYVVQLVNFAAADNRMASVRPSLIADDTIVVRRQ